MDLEKKILLQSYEFIRTIVSSRIVTIEPHEDNFICSRDGNYFSSEYDERFYLIDLGLSEIVDDDQYNYTVNFYKNNNFVELLNYVYMIYRKVIYESDVKMHFKELINKIEQIEDFNGKMNLLITNRNDKIKELLMDNTFFDLVKHNSILNFK